jgi:hypothetical protein
MDKAEMDKLRSSVLYKGEILKVRYIGNASNFPKNQEIDAVPRFAMKNGFPYPQPKWIACDYYVRDLDGDYFEVATERYGKLHKDFEWVY